ncbi:hypothetical protein EVAR_50386_1 [Eumeta japonica]|uniref:IGFBP N-terminal domain-containing protein n=1 Tax=Eumeta variegata TaxID=151549 RepID=A0A4C1WWC8_EUMVA|nr:hypothetical protein EVAR_50386_1 [Eumeta japonica]
MSSCTAVSYIKIRSRKRLATSWREPEYLVDTRKSTLMVSALLQPLDVFERPPPCYRDDVLGPPTRDRHSCCKVCARTLGEDCGGFRGTCEPGLKCYEGSCSPIS